MRMKSISHKILTTLFLAMPLVALSATSSCQRRGSTGDDAFERLVSELTECGVVVRDDSDGLSIHIVDNRASERKVGALLADLNQIRPVRRFYATSGDYVPDSELFESVGNLPSVTRLAVGNLSDLDAQRSLRAFPNAEVIELLDVTGGGGALPVFSHARQFESDVKLDDAGLERISEMTSIEILDVYLSADATASGTVKLKSLTQLKELYIGVPESERIEAVQALVEALDGVSIVIEEF